MTSMKTGDNLRGMNKLEFFDCPVPKKLKISLGHATLKGDLRSDLIKGTLTSSTGASCTSSSSSI